MKNSRPILHLLIVLLMVLVSGCTWYTSFPPVSTLPAEYVVAPGATPVTIETMDGLTLFGQWWEPAPKTPPETPTKAVVLLVHGTALHSGFYAPYAQMLAETGYSVFGIDLRGWGQSQGRGRRGFIRNYDEYLEDIRQAYSKIKQRHPDLPLFLQGESMGGAVVLLSQIYKRIEVDGLILNAPAVRPAISIGSLHTPNWLADYTLWVDSLPGALFPNHPILFPGRVTEMLMGASILEDKDALERFKNDPLVLHKALPLSYITGIQDATARIETGLPFMQAPVLFLHGTKDVLVPLSSSQFAMRHMASEDKTLITYNGMRHATLHDTDRQKVWRDIINWMDQRVSGPRAELEDGGACTD